jgi:hypothetical protein
MQKKKINNIEIKPIFKKDTRLILHKDIVNNATPIILICGKKGSGK